MMTCSHCHAPLEDDAKFCDMCGTPVSASPAAASPVAAPPIPEPPMMESPVPLMLESTVPEPAMPDALVTEQTIPEALVTEPAKPNQYCPHCGKPTDPDSPFCGECGGSLTAESAGASGQPDKKAKKQKKPKAPKTPEEIKDAKKTKKIILFGCISVISAIIAVTAFSLVGKGVSFKLPFVNSGGSSSKLPNCALYVKDKEIYYSGLSKKEPLQVTSRLVNDRDYDGNAFSYSAPTFGAMCQFSKDGTLLFFPDKLDGLGLGLGSGYSLYYRKVGKPKEDAVRIDSDVASYIVSDDASTITYRKNGMLYQYNRKKEERTKIASDVTSYRASGSGKTVLYLNEDDMLYSVLKGGEKEKVDSDVSELCYASDDLSLLFYLKDGNLYRKKEGKDKEKVASDVTRVLRAYKSGEVYYLKSEDGEVALKDFVVDDKKKDDASMREPEYPSWSDPDYNSKYEAYQKAMEEIYAKQNRDSLRESLKEYTLPIASYTLCYDDGNKEKDVVVSESFRDSNFSIAPETPVIVYGAYDSESDVSVKLSEITDLYEVEQQVMKGRDENVAHALAVCGASTPLDLEDAVSLRLSSDGKTLCYLAEVPKEKDYGELYKLSISSGKLGTPEKVDSDVYTGYMRYTEGSKLLYYKDYKDNKGELYWDGEKIDYDVRSGIGYDKGTGKITYYTDWNGEKSYGTLKCYTKKEAVKISDDVHDYLVTSKGDVLYLSDYSMKYYRGELYLWDSKKATKIDEDVVCIIPVH